jgi:transcriptional regulator with XRE-family HTH domain
MSKKRVYKLKRHYTELGSFLCESREKANLTQREVSIKLGYSSAQFISNFERGIAAPPLQKLKVMVKMYSMPAGTVTRKLLAAEEQKIMEVLYSGKKTEERQCPSS